MKRILNFIKSAGASSESDSTRDGFLSWHAESHAVAVGAGIGYTLTATGDARMVGVFITAVSAGLRGRTAGQPSAVLQDVAQEPHYAVAGFVLGAVAGRADRLAAGLV